MNIAAMNIRSVGIEPVGNVDLSTAAPLRARPQAPEIYWGDSEEGRSNKNEFFQRMSWFLEKGTLPEYISESGNLILEGESDVGDTIIKWVKQVVDRLALASTGKPSPALRICLADLPGPHARVITKANPPILVIGLGLLDMLVSNGFGEDHFAAILGHERFHLRRQETWNDLGNGRPEETIADVYGVMEAHRAGYNPAAIGNFLRSLQSRRNHREDHFFEGLSEMLDEHAPLATRVRNTEVALANLQLTQRMTDKQTPIPQDVVAALDVVHHKNHLMRFMEHKEYDECSPDQQVRLLVQYAIETAKILDEPDKKSLKKKPKQYWGNIAPLKSLRIGLLRQHFSSFYWKPSVRNQALRSFRMLMRQKLDYAGRQGSLGWVLYDLLRLTRTEKTQEELDREARRRKYDPDFSDVEVPDVSPDQLPVVFRRYRENVKNFVEATTIAEAVAAAHKAKQDNYFFKAYLRGIYHFSSSGGWDRTAFSEFFSRAHMSWPKLEEIKTGISSGAFISLPWEKLLRFALAANKQEARLITETAYMLGAKDLRFPELSEDEQKYLHEYGVPKRGKFFADFGFDDLTFDQDGRIVAIHQEPEKPKEVDRRDHARFAFETAAELFGRETRLQQARDEREIKLVKTVEWQELRRNFWGFVAKHAKDLSPDQTVVSGQHPFAREFTRQMDMLVAADPQKWRDTYIEFLTGYSLKKQKKRDYFDDGYDEEKIKYIPNSMPDILNSFYKDYAVDHFYNGGREIQRGRLPATHPYYKRLGAYVETARNDTGKWITDERTGKERYKRIPRKPLPRDKQEIFLETGVDSRHPYIDALIQYRDDRISPQHLGGIIGKFAYADRNARTTDRYFRADIAAIFGYRPSLAVRELNALIRNADASNKHGYAEVTESLAAVEGLRLLRSLDGLTLPQRFSISSLDQWVVYNGFRFMADRKAARRHKQELGRLVERQIERNRSIDFGESVELNELVDRFLIDHGAYAHCCDPEGRRYNQERGRHSIFSRRLDLELAYEERICERIMAVPRAERLKPLEGLLTISLNRPAFRRWAVNEWAEAVAEHLGADDGGSDYATKAMTFIERSLSELVPSQTLGGVIKLLDLIESQRDVALATKSILANKFGREFLTKDVAARMVDQAVEACGNEAELRSAFLAYITETPTYEGTRVFIRKLVENAEHSDFVRDTIRRQRNENLTPQQEVMQVDHLHQNFWSLPFEIRTIYLDRLLFPPNQELGKIFDEATAFVLDKVLPIDKKFAPEAREALLVYLDCCPPELRRVTFSALLAAAEQLMSGDDMRPGQVLSYVLTRTGAAGGQLLQAGHSYLSGMDLHDPDFIQFRDDLKDSKVDFARPFRWEVFERMDEVLPEYMRQNFAHVGKVLGCGSTAYVVACHTADGETAVKMMRKDVLSIADLQFERFRAAFMKLAQKYSHYGFLPSLVDRAVETINVSTNGFIAAEQVKYAEGIYNHLSVAVNGEHYMPHVARLVSCGTEYLETEVIQGSHLNEMPEGKNKQYAAIAIDAVEEFLTSIGVAVDEDCHNGQQKIAGMWFGRFDLGAVPYDLVSNHIAMPTKNQKRALGKLYGLIVNAALAGQSPVQAMLKAVATGDWGKEKQFLVGMQRARLARMDFFAAFGDTPQAKQAIQQKILQAVWKTGRMDNDILSGMMETLSVTAALKIAGLMATNSVKKLAVSGDKEIRHAEMLQIKIDDGQGVVCPQRQPIKLFCQFLSHKMQRTMTANLGGGKA